MSETNNKAPTLSELEASKPPVHELETKQPTVQIIGCGGCGVNWIKAFIQTNPKFDSDIKMSIIDTSMSNTRQLRSDVQVYGIGGLEGSGKDRSLNRDAIFKFLDNNKKLVTDATDITILLFSLAGGSGSVIAPELAHRLMRHSNRAVVLVCVADVSSEKDCLNTIKTLVECSKNAKQGKYYLPMMLFSNINCDKKVVDKTAVTRLIELVDMLTSKNITEIDFNDKINYLRATNIGCPSGCYLLFVATEGADGQISDLSGEMNCELERGDRVHVCFVVNDTGIVPDIKTTVSYPGISNTKKFFSTIGTAIPQTLIDTLNDTKEEYKNSKIEVDNLENSFGDLES